MSTYQLSAEGRAQLTGEFLDPVIAMKLPKTWVQYVLPPAPTAPGPYLVGDVVAIRRPGVSETPWAALDLVKPGTFLSMTWEQVWQKFGGPGKEPKRLVLPEVESCEDLDLADCAVATVDYHGRACGVVLTHYEEGGGVPDGTVVSIHVEDVSAYFKPKDAVKAGLFLLAAGRQAQKHIEGEQ